jgi:hypothetical protein
MAVLGGNENLAAASVVLADGTVVQLRPITPDETSSRSNPTGRALTIYREATERNGSLDGRTRRRGRETRIDHPALDELVDIPGLGECALGQRRWPVTPGGHPPG